MHAQSTKTTPAKPTKSRHESFKPITDDPKLPRVLLIGDSISMGYTVPVRELLAGKANVHRIAANGGPTTRGLANIDKWLGSDHGNDSDHGDGSGDWDLIHFNWGIHDLRYMPSGLRQVEPADYEKNLRTLVERLKKTGAKLVWASTTPIPQGKLNPDRSFGDEREYNAIAAKLMATEDVVVNDLHAYVWPRFDELHRPRDLHFEPHGSKFLAKQVARVIESNLPTSGLKLLQCDRIWDKAPHNAFTDLLRFDDRWYCVFREGAKHISPDGALRVLTSVDGKDWQSLSLVTSTEFDLRDAKISVTPDNRLMLNGAGMIADADIRYHSMSWFSDDAGKTWDQGRKIGDPGFWLWRAQWHDGFCYSMGYNTDRDREKRTVRLYRSTDGADFQTHVQSVETPKGCGEDQVLFLKDGTALCLMRHETGNKMAQLGTSKPPYTDWSWRDTNLRLGGPKMIGFADGRILVGARLYDQRVRTSLCWLDPESATLTEELTLPSGGDTSYPGMVMHDGYLWVSYYSSHESKTSIYFAKVKLPAH